MKPADRGPRHYWLQNTEYLQLHLIASSIDWLLKGYCCLWLSRAAFVTRDNKCDNSTEPWCTCTQSSMSQESFNHQVLKIMRFHKPTNKPMLRSLQWSTWNIVKSQEYFARPKYYVSPEKIHQPSGISIYWWHLEPVVSGLSVSWAMWHEAVMAGKYESMGGNSRDTGARAPGDQNLVTAPDCREDKTWD